MDSSKTDTKAQYWSEHFTAWEASGLSQVEYCKQHDLKLANFTYWLPKGLLGKALGYFDKNWDKLTIYTKDGRLSIDNNRAENAIRPFVIGGKNWLFSATTSGAKASANLYGLIETAKANGLEPYAYLRRVFTELPGAQGVEDIEALLPWRAPEKKRQILEGGIMKRVMNINIGHLDADELMALNQRIIERLKMLESLHAHQSMMQFHPGAKVSFDSPQGERVIATVMKFNRKTVTVATDSGQRTADSGQRWNVSPHLLSAIKDAAQNPIIEGRLEND